MHLITKNNNFEILVIYRDEYNIEVPGKQFCVLIPMKRLIYFAIDCTNLQGAGFPSRKQQSNPWHRSVVNGVNIFFYRRIIAVAHVPCLCAFRTDFQSLLTAFVASSSLGNYAERRDFGWL